MISLPVVMLQFSEGCFVFLLFQVSQDAAADNPFDELKHLLRLSWAIGQQMQVVRHNDVGKQQKST